MRGITTHSVLEQELSRLLRDALGDFRRETDELNRIASCMERAAAELSGFTPEEPATDRSVAVRAGAAQAASLLITLQIRLASLEGIGVALSLLRRSLLEQAGEAT